MEQIGDGTGMAAELNDLLGQSTSEKGSYPYDCTVCKDTGWDTRWVEKSRGGHTGAVRCECWQERIAESRLSQIHDQFGIYADARLEKFDPKNSGQRDAHAIITASPLGNYFLHGIHGRGKTFLLVAQYRYVAKKGIPCQIRTSKQLVDELKTAELSDGRPSVVMELASTAKKFHFFWDDCEKAGARTDFRQETIFDLVDTLRRRGLGISVTSNLPLIDSNGSPENPIDLRFKLSSPIVSRLDPMCRSILL